MAVIGAAHYQRETRVIVNWNIAILYISTQHPTIASTLYSQNQKSVRMIIPHSNVCEYMSYFMPLFYPLCLSCLMALMYRDLPDSTASPSWPSSKPIVLDLLVPNIHPLSHLLQLPLDTLAFQQY